MDQVKPFNIQTSPVAAYSTIERWTRNIDLFGKTWVILPAYDKKYNIPACLPLILPSQRLIPCFSRLHWYLFFICHPRGLVATLPNAHTEPTSIFVLDSLGTGDLQAADIVGSFLLLEAGARGCALGVEQNQTPRIQSIAAQVS